MTPLDVLATLTALLLMVLLAEGVNATARFALRHVRRWRVRREIRRFDLTKGARHA